MGSLNDKLAARKFPHRDVTICLDADLLDARDAALAALNVARSKVQAAEKAATDGGGDGRLGATGKPELKKAQKALEDVEASIRAASITIRITAVPFGQYNQFMSKNPGRKGLEERFNVSTFFIYVARRTGKYVDDAGAVHDISEVEWDQIEAALTDEEHDRLASAVVQVNRQDSGRGLDFLSSGSGTTPLSSEKPEPLETSESPTDD